MNYTLLQHIWYLFLCGAVVFYTVLDGFDLGVGALHLFVKKDKERRTFLNAIGPVWDGNAVWLVVVGGALFAGFPLAYATIFSSFYTLLMIFLSGIIFRAVAIEFRSKKESRRWRSFWDVFFSLSSIVMAFGLGVLLGNLIEGIPLDNNQIYLGNFWTFVKPYTVLVGLMSLSLFTMHGSIYLLMKTEGELQEKIRRWTKPIIITFLVTYVATTLYTIYGRPYMTLRMRANPWLYIVPSLSVLSILNICREAIKKREGRAFLSSALSIAFLFALFGIGTYPTILRSSLDPMQNSVTLFNSSSSPLTLKILLTVALIGIPLALGYGFMVYRIFRGKVKIDSTSY